VGQIWWCIEKNYLLIKILLALENSFRLQHQFRFDEDKARCDPEVVGHPLPQPFAQREKDDLPLSPDLGIGQRDEVFIRRT